MPIDLDLAEATRQDLVVTLAGNEYALPVRTLRDLGPLQAWFKRLVPSPLTRTIASLDQCDRQGIATPSVLRSALFDTALRQERTWPPRPGSIEWLAAVEDADQIHHLIAWGLGPRHPNLTDDAARTIVREATVEELSIYFFGLFTGRLPDPKSPALGTPIAVPNPSAETQDPPTTGHP